MAGLWHLGSVTAACLAAAGHDVVGLDADRKTVARLNEGKPPVLEPGLGGLTLEGIAAKRLRFTTDPETIRDRDVIWIAYDTPVDDDDRADPEIVITHVRSLFPFMKDNALVVISSQLPVGSTARLEDDYIELKRPEAVSFVYSPENLRLGKAIDVFMKPDRVVAGARREQDRVRFGDLMAPITTSIEWMSVESAEMTKHALNAFLATSVTFINEIARICERVGADAKEVERGLKTDIRIGPRAYLSPGAAFAGGTLARDITFLSTIESLPLITSVKRSNDLHKTWVLDRLHAELGKMQNRKICVWGLTYKPGTDTLRRSSAIELCEALAWEGAQVTAFDPAVKRLSPELASIIDLKKTAREAAADADAVVVATEWPEIRESAKVALPQRPISVIDANRFLAAEFADRPHLRYFSVGKASR
ncbi:MAG TPA: nucleotide sugar dehydrogenase [Thermoanaerobaculia bacterium]|nr:nucleotide sugar dehydrogenase [Thermoanaerobaculia bacterium]